MDTMLRQEDATFFELFFVPPLRRGWYEEIEFSDGDSDELLEFDDLILCKEIKLYVREQELSVCGGGFLNVV